jgi:hypothetical protein
MVTYKYLQMYTTILLLDDTILNQQCTVVLQVHLKGHLAPVFRFIIQLLWSTKQLISCVLCIQYRDNVGLYICSNVVIQNPAELCEYRYYLFPKGCRTRARVCFLICEKSFTRSRFLAKYGLQLDINYPLSEINVLLTVTHRNMSTFTLTWSVETPL